MLVVASLPAWGRRNPCGDHVSAELTSTQMPVEHRQTERVQKYAKRWDKDSANDTDAHKQQRLDEYTEVVNGASTFLDQICPLAKLDVGCVQI